jgi:hypothetical protein
MTPFSSPTSEICYIAHGVVRSLLQLKRLGIKMVLITCFVVPLYIVSNVMQGGICVQAVHQEKYTHYIMGKEEIAERRLT